MSSRSKSTTTGTSAVPPKLKTYVDSLTTGAKLKVLIFGPGASGGDLYEKRCHLRDVIREAGHIAEFCEDIYKSSALDTSGLNLGAAEYLMVKSYDYIVCLMVSPGSIAEVHDFAKDFSIKMMICADKTHQGGYSAQSVIRIFEGKNGKMDWFDYPCDITECHLASRVLAHIAKVAEAKQWEIVMGGNS